MEKERQIKAGPRKGIKEQAGGDASGMVVRGRLKTEGKERSQAGGAQEKRQGTRQNQHKGTGNSRKGRKQLRKMRPAEGTRRSHWAPRPAEKREERAEGEAQGAASLRGPKPGPREAPPQPGPTGGGGAQA